MDIYSILATKPHDERYLKRYTRFIEYCKDQNSTLKKRTKRNPSGTYLEEHHICPKAVDLFPEYNSFWQFPWNKILLTAKQHYIAHMLLWKVYGGSQAKAFFAMSMATSDTMDRYWRCTAKMYEQLRLDYSLVNSKNASGEQNPFHGRKHTEEAKEKNRLAHLGKIPHNKGKPIPPHVQAARQAATVKVTKGSLWITDGLSNKRVPKDHILQSGWRFGRAQVGWKGKPGPKKSTTV